MHLKKFISLWALMALMLGQLALAEHNASHMDHHLSSDVVAVHYEDHGHEHDHDHQKETKEHQCPECLLTKSLQTAFFHSPKPLLVALSSEDLTSIHQSLAVKFYRNKANAPRAPPVILI
jgi:ABC-type Zn2+ transport system substrate-binding protein/surface adhesin